MVFRRKGLAKSFILVALAILILRQNIMPLMMTIDGRGGVLTAKFGARSSTISTTPLRLDRDDEWNARPMGLHRCVTVRLRGVENQDMTVDEARNYLQSRNHSAASLRFGLVFVEDPDRFVALAKGAFHLYHFLEFLVIAYQELHHLKSSPSSSSTTTTTFSTLAQQGSPLITVPWVYVPLFTKQEICGAAGGINCLIMDLVLQASINNDESSSSPDGDRWITNIHGLESNDHVMMAHHSAFAGNYSEVGKKRFFQPDSVHVQNARHDAMVETVDAILLVHRFYCGKEQQQNGSINKMWANHIDNFPTQQWYQDVSRGLQQQSRRSDPTKPQQQQLTVGYLDRQNTKRRLPDDYHKWLIEYLGNQNNKIYFRHLHMENYTALEQLAIAQDCDVLIGIHGNGLSHQLFMKPQRYVVELYWNIYTIGFHFDYATAAQLMKHKYMALLNGRIMINPERIAKRDPKLMGMRVNDDDDMNNNNDNNRTVYRKRALQEFLQEAIKELISTLDG